MPQNFFRRLNEESTRTHTPEMDNLLERLRGMVDSYKFTDFREPKKYIDTIMMSSKDASTRLGVTDSHVRRIRALLSKDAYDFFGDDIFDDIYMDKVDSVITRLNNASSSFATKLILGEILDRIPRDVGAGIDIRDCTDEIEYLRKYSLTGIMNEYGQLNPKHLSKILDILDGPATGTRDNLVKVLYRK